MAMINVKLCSIIMLSFCYCNAATIAIVGPADSSTAFPILKAPESLDQRIFSEKYYLNQRSPEDIMKILQNLGKDSNGLIDIDDLKMILLGFSPEGRALSVTETTPVTADGDSDHDGKIGSNAPESLDQRIFSEKSYLDQRSPEDIMKILHFLGKDSNGLIDIDDVRGILQGFSPEGRPLSVTETVPVTADVDSDHDGKIGSNAFSTTIDKDTQPLNYLQSTSSVLL